MHGFEDMNGPCNAIWLRSKPAEPHPQKPKTHRIFRPYGAQGWESSYEIQWPHCVWNGLMGIVAEENAGGKSKSRKNSEKELL